MFEHLFDTLLAEVTSTPTSARTSHGGGLRALRPGRPRGVGGVELIIRDELGGVGKMRRYDDPVDVRKGMVTGAGGARLEGPEQFLWRGRLWKVCDVVGHWVETGPWWRPAEADAGAEAGTAGGAPAAPLDLLAEREVWRVEAARGRTLAGTTGRGVFDLVFDWADGTWQLARCAD